MAAIAGVIDAIFQAIACNEEARRNKDKAKYEKTYWEMEYIWRNHTNKLRELEKLREHITRTRANFLQNMNYVPPSLKVDAFPIHCQGRIVQALNIQPPQIPAHATFNAQPNVVHIPQMPPVNLPVRMDNTGLYQSLQDTYAGLQHNHQTFESNFRNDMNRLR